ncbi:MAG: AHH domain-containing protein, partial [Planctomycetota bacterium]
LKVKVKPDDSTSESQWPNRVYTYNSEGKALSVTDATSKLTEYTYDVFGRLATVLRKVDADHWKKATLTYKNHTAASHRWLEKILYQVSEVPQGQSQAVVTDLLERSWERDYLGRTTKSHRKSLVNVTITHTLTFDYNGLSRIDDVTDNNGRKTSYQYDAGGYLRKVLDNLSGSNQNATEALRNIYGEVTDLTQILDLEDQSSSHTAVSYLTKFVYDELGRIKQADRYGTSSGVLATRKYGFDSLDNLVLFGDEELDNAYRVTEFEFDALGRQRKTIRNPRSGAGGSAITTTTDYDDITGSVNEGSDHFGRSLTDGLLSQIVTQTDARGHTTKHYYDKLERFIHRRLPGWSSGAQRKHWSYAHDNEGRLEKWKDGNSKEVRILRDSYGRPTTRFVANPDTSLSLMTTYERFVYDDPTLTATQKTFYGAWLSPTNPDADPTGADLLNQVTVETDGLGRILEEEFGFLDSGSSTPLWTKALDHGYQIPAGGEDTGFRRSLHAVGSDWLFGFTPDGAGKLRQIQVAPPAGGGSHSYDDTYTYTYEGGRTATRKYDQQHLGGTPTAFTTVNTYDQLGYLNSIKTWYGAVGSGTKVFEFDQGLDLVGQVRWRRYSKVNGKAGDWFKLDGFGRVAEVKLGVSSSDIDDPDNTDTFASASNYDEKLTYAIDQVNNWDSLTSTVTGTTDVDIADNSNEYESFGAIPLLYDNNGNLAYDGTRIFVYDYLDRLCEIYQYIEVESLSSSQSSKSAGVTSWEQVKNLLAIERTADLPKTVFSYSASYYNAHKTWGSKSKESSSSTTSSGYWLLWALYGYAPDNRRIVKTTAAPSEEWWYVYDGWQVLEEWKKNTAGTDIDIVKVNFDGVGIDEHLGFALYSGSLWTRFVLTQDSLNHVHAVLDPANGNALERYDYDAYGVRKIYRQVGGNWTLQTSSAYQSDYGYIGRRHDTESDLLYIRNRYYYPAVGRYLTVDPIGVWGDVYNFGNDYAYAGNASSMRLDQNGLHGLELQPGPSSDVGPSPAEERQKILEHLEKTEAEYRKRQEEWLEESKRLENTAAILNGVGHTLAFPAGLANGITLGGSTAVLGLGGVKVDRVKESPAFVAGEVVSAAVDVAQAGKFIIVHAPKAASGCAGLIGAGCSVVKTIARNRNALRAALKAVGQIPRAGEHAHHIVALGHRMAAPARSLLRKFKIGIDDAVNGVLLPRNAAAAAALGSSAVPHAGIHTTEYLTRVNELLSSATNREQAIEILGSIAQSLLGGRLP